MVNASGFIASGGFFILRSKNIRTFRVMWPLEIYIAVIVTIILFWILFGKKYNEGTPDDPTGEMKQEIMDKLDSAINDIKLTIKN